MSADRYGLGNVADGEADGPDEADTAWNAPMRRADDEIMKLRSGDHVARNVERNRRAIAQDKGQ